MNGCVFGLPMNQYLRETEFASKNLFKLATFEEGELAVLREKLMSAEKEFDANHILFRNSDLHEDYPDSFVMNAYSRAMEAGSKVMSLKPKVKALRARVSSHQTAVQAIAAAILQIAKQGISLEYGRRSAAPPGRALGSLYLRDIIWQGRNQSMHYDDDKPKEPVLILFKTLTQQYGEQFSLAKYAKQSRAKQILDVLGWNSYESYMHDMQELLPH